MRTKLNVSASATLVAACTAAVMFTCSAIAYSPFDDKHKTSSQPAPARPAPSRPAPAPQQRTTQSAPQTTAPAQRTIPQVGRQPSQTTRPPVYSPHPSQTNRPPVYNPSPSQTNRPPVYNPHPSQTNRPPSPPNKNPPWSETRPGSTTTHPGRTYPPNGPSTTGQPNPHSGTPSGITTVSRPLPSSAPPPRVYTTKQGATAEFRGNNVRTLTTPTGMRVTQVGAQRQVVVRRNDRLIVANGRTRGFVQRDVVVRNQRLVQRTYYVNGVSYVHVYRPYVYRETIVNVYTPVRYYSPRFYAYAYSPWRNPVYYQWYWANDPWYDQYGRAYFAPYPVYAGPSLWLTDYMLAANFRDAYQSGLDAGARMEAANAAPMDDNVKQLVSDEVQRQLQWERGLPQTQNTELVSPLADQRTHTLIANTSLNAEAGGQECVITEGDVVQYDDAQQAHGPNADVRMLWSKPDDCPSGTVATLPIEQVQEMSNHMVETLNQGLQEYQSRQGQNGLPKLARDLNGSTQAPFAADLPPADPNVADELQQQAAAADSEVSQAVEEAARAAAPPPEPERVESQPHGAVTRPDIRIAKNMTADEVIAQIGNPTNTINDGKHKKIFIYTNPNLKITFDKDRVRKVE